MNEISMLFVSDGALRKDTQLPTGSPNLAFGATDAKLSAPLKNLIFSALEAKRAP